MKLSCGGRVASGRSYPSTSDGIVSRAGVPKAGTESTPDDHFGARPHCRVRPAASRRVDGNGRCPHISSGIVSPAGVQIATEPLAAPDYHFVAGPHCRVNLATNGRINGAGRCPTIRAGIVSPASVEVLGRASPLINTSPDNHFTASPHCRVTFSCGGRVASPRADPTICDGIVSSAGVHIIVAICSAPDDHFTAGPDRRLLESTRRRVGGAGSRPTVGVGIISPTCVENAGTESTPDDHFSAGPDCAVVASAGGRVGDAGGCPAIVCAWRIPFGNSWKSVGAVCNSRCRRHASQIFAAGGLEAPFVVRR